MGICALCPIRCVALIFGAEPAFRLHFACPMVAVSQTIGSGLRVLRRTKVTLARRRRLCSHHAGLRGEAETEFRQQCEAEST